MHKPIAKASSSCRWYFVIATDPVQDWNSRYLEVFAESPAAAGVKATAELTKSGRGHWSLDLVVEADAQGVSAAG